MRRVEYFAARRAVGGNGIPKIHSVRLQTVAERLGLRPVRNAGDGVDLAGIDPAWVAARSALHRGATRFRLFRVSREARAFRRQAERDLAAEAAI